jgi:hypothetical protein
MGVSHGRSRISELAFRVFGRSLHPDWFTVREHRRVGAEGWEADLRVIDGGHAVVFRCGEVRLTEVLAGPATPLPEPGLLFHSQVRHERTATLRPSPAVEYQTCFEVERVDPEVFAHLNDEATLDASHGRLFHRFDPVNRMAPAPVSDVRFEARRGGLTVHTFHSFPEERAIVRTQSLFEPRRVRPG